MYRKDLVKVMIYIMDFWFLKKLWYCVGGRVKHKLVLSNELIKVEFST